MALDLVSCMKSFTSVAECKSFSEAARQLHSSTPVITKQMQRLENIVGKKLFNRTTRHVALTEAGEIYWVHVKNILNEIKNSRNAVHNLEQEPHGQVILGLPGVFNSMFFIKILHDFLNKYPKITLQTTDENSPFNLLNNSIDLAISENNIYDKKFNKEYLFTIRRGIFASPNYIKKYMAPKKISDLKNHNCLVYKRISPNNEWVFANNKKIKVNGNYSSISGKNILAAACAGIGLLWAPEINVMEEIKSRKLIEIKLENKPVEMKMYLYYRPAHQGSNVKLIVDYLKQSMVGMK